MNRPYGCALGLGLLFAASVAGADPSGDATKARLHFDRGLELVDRGEIGAAAAEFQRAYELAPHPSVLFNLGRAYSALGRHSDAARALRKYLEESKGLEPARRAQVENLLQFNAAKTGALEVELEPAAAELVVDGRSLGRGPFPEPIELDAGAHGVLVTAPNRIPSFQTIEVRAAERHRIAISLELEPTERSLGQLSIACHVPAAGVEIDGAAIGQTPIDPLLLPAGAHRVVFRRDGFIRSEHDVSVPPRGRASVACRMRLDAAAPSASARLRIESRPKVARVTVDGEPFAGRPLPAGVHELTIEHAGYESYRRSVELAPRSTTFVSARLQPSEETQRRTDAERFSQQRIWAAVLGGSGLLLAGGAATLYFVNTSRLDDWDAERAEVDGLLASGVVDEGARDRNEELQLEAASIQRTDDAALGLAIAGGGAIAAALWLWFTADPAASSGDGRRQALSPRRTGLSLSW